MTSLADGTLAFFPQPDDRRSISARFSFSGIFPANITDPALPKRRGRTLYGICDAQAIDRMVQTNADSLL